MPRSRLLLGGALLIAAALCLLTHYSSRPTSPSHSVVRANHSVPAPPASDVAARSSNSSAPQHDPAPTSSPRYAESWAGPQPAALAAFRAWTERYRLAPSLAARLALEPEGVALAQARRPEMRRLIVTDPQRALAVTVPAAIRQALPPSVIHELETRIAGRGDYALQISEPFPDEPQASPAGPTLRRIVHVGGTTYTAHSYGRRESQVTKEGASLHGITLDGEFALHDSPVRLLEPGEDITQAEPACVACNTPVSASAASPADYVALEDRIWPVHTGELDSLLQRASAAEDRSGPRVAALGAPADPATPHTTGTKQVLVIRTDTSDFPGEPVAEAAARDLINGAVNTMYQDMSYGQTNLVATVTPLYRLPRTGASYATADDYQTLLSDARTLAAPAYTAANYDRVIVVFPNLSTSRVPGSKFTFAGRGNLIGTNIWINGPTAFVMTTLTHELGHTYGLRHASLWRVPDQTPFSARGNTLEYGDPFDMMGTSSVTGVTRDTRHHFSHWAKNNLGWLPDGAVNTVTRTGTYRVHRFDNRNAPRDQPLALRIFRDGVRWYWIGLRQNFSTGTPRADGAYIIWGHNQNLQTQLLDLTTPGASANDAALAVGATFNDPLYGVTIKPIARGGDEPSQWLDVEITLRAAPPNVVTAWGRNNATFYDTETGEDIIPAPDTNVPMDLTGVQAIAAGEQHALALKSDGTVVAWGNHAAGQIAVPANLGPVVAIAAGGNVSGVVKADGTVQLWGDAQSGILTPPAGLSNVRQLAIGGGNSTNIYHALALKSDGTIVAWGDNTRNQATIPANIGTVAAIAASDRLSVALRTDGSVIRWGTTFANAVPFPTGLNDVTAIATSGGAGHTLALKRDGTVVAWGNNGNGQATVPANLANVVAIATGSFHSLALKSDGTIAAWGSAGGGRLVAPPALPRVAALAGSGAASFALTGTGLRILEQPASQVAGLNGIATLRVNATSNGPLAYQWRKDGVAIAGATASSYTITPVATTSAGNYDVVITDSGLTFTSAAANITVGTAVETSRIANLSIRTNAGTGAQTLIVGFAIGGANTSGNKALLIRGVGPTLAGFGVSGALTDPKVELYGSSQTKLFENDNWAAADADVFTAVGAFALTANSRDAALYNSALPSGSYSAQLSGSGSASGIVLAEIYDATSTFFAATTPRLVNVSARTFSGTGSDVLIAGFAIAGPTSKKVLIRAIGPTLSGFGVGDVLADPKLELFNSAQAKVQENDNWGGSAALAAAFDSVGAFRLEAGSRDAALLVELAPGTYTAQVGGVNNGTGVALVEIYEVP